MDGKSFYLICLINSFHQDVLKTLRAKKIEFLFVERENSKRVKYLTTLPHLNDNDIGETDTLTGSHIKIQKFEKELMLISKIKS